MEIPSPAVSQRRSTQTPRTAVVVAVLAFVVLGVAESGIGTAWPSISDELGVPLADLGTLLAAGLGGYSILSALSGAISHRLGLGVTLVVAAVLSLSGVGLYILTASWPLVLIAAFTLGCGGGLLDSSLNAHAAHRFTPGAMNLLHAGFGVGATLAPILVATAIGIGAGWRAAYVAIATVQAALLVLLVERRSAWSFAAPAPRRTTRLRFDPVVALSLAMFFVYTGIEIATGQWSFTVLTEGRGLATGQAGVWVAAYWGGLTAGRLGLSAIATRQGPRRILAYSMVGTIAGTGLFWWNPLGLGVWGLPLAGVSLAGIFPTLVTLTPQRIGIDRTTAIVGYQLAAASLGAAAVPWAIGRAIGATSLDVVGPIIAGSAVMMAALNGLLDRTAPAQQLR